MKHLVLTLALLPTWSWPTTSRNQPRCRWSTSATRELVLRKEISYQPWQSKVLTGKVFLIQHTRVAPAPGGAQCPMIEAIRAAKLPPDKYQTVTIINSNDAIWGVRVS